jgi:amidase
MAQARHADKQRTAGKRGALLGIPIAVKDLYDTKDMPTTNGSLTFEGFQPAHYAYQVARLREAGAVIIGKASMEKYATSGNYSDSAYGTVWNAFDPSRSALASSGGSAVATAASLAAAALGSHTSDSLYAPASAASLVTLRGTDGMESDRDVMPLSWLRTTRARWRARSATSPTSSTSSPGPTRRTPRRLRQAPTGRPTGAACSTRTH